jgi:hypothetical protein
MRYPQGGLAKSEPESMGEFTKENLDAALCLLRQVGSLIGKWHLQTCDKK